MKNKRKNKKEKEIRCKEKIEKKNLKKNTEDINNYSKFARMIALDEKNVTGDKYITDDKTYFGFNIISFLLNDSKENIEYSYKNITDDIEEGLKNSYQYIYNVKREDIYKDIYIYKIKDAQNFEEELTNIEFSLSRYNKDNIKEVNIMNFDIYLKKKLDKKDESIKDSLNRKMKFLKKQLKEMRKMKMNIKMKN